MEDPLAERASAFWLETLKKPQAGRWTVKEQQRGQSIVRQTFVTRRVLKDFGRQVRHRCPLSRLPRRCSP